jgi:diaminohydroxyphosphoribosylaminopyrimidine deaminase/5-amino-6-(5-phosphoribosylamino)uracil reductase
MRTGFPIQLKLGASLDGRTAMASGESQWITSPQARRDVQRLRAQSHAILTSSATVLADDPA